MVGSEGSGRARSPACALSELRRGKHSGHAGAFGEGGPAALASKSGRKTRQRSINSADGLRTNTIDDDA